ncbi:hypothetical protein C4D60_Mb09t13090 [Musa balbisiana]|uniref:Protein kinase domain-containing protein n=1 Tax=Musa balbisiana TaxID=52838 RepID=A0A4S8IG12_MUSBA|nr:hypothetical protein C4D60_Mb09t13090 [Musa balbisiana]
MSEEEKKKETAASIPAQPMAAALALLFHHHRCHPRHRLLLLLLLLVPVYSAPELAPLSDTNALLLLKDSFTNATALSSWTPTNSNPCNPSSPWRGVLCLHDIVTGLHLSDMGLSGSINVDALSRFTGLRIVSFANNSFSGPIPPLGRLHALKAIYLSRNHFSDAIPTDFFDGMTRLKKLWLNDNAFTGLIPYSLSKATALLELRLEDNHFSGSIPALILPSLSSLNLSNNLLEGAIPDVYSSFNASSFLGNKDLCGEQLDSQSCKTMTHMGNDKVLVLCFVTVVLVCLAMYLFTKRERSGESALDTVQSQRKLETEATSPGSPHEDYQRAFSSRPKGGSINGYGRMESSRKPVGNGGEGGSGGGADGGDGGGGGGGGGGAADLVMVNDRKGAFGLPDLMKAAAEVMGSGGLGSAYKAVMANGVAVVVKRIRDMNRVGKEAFDAEMRRLGCFVHPNLLPPLAYHYRKDEKLLVYEYIPKGSLLYVLHGDRGLDYSSLDWPTRLKIARGVARGLAYLHAEQPPVEAPHGNLKSSNVLLAPDFEPLLVDYGFLPLVNPAQAPTTMQAHRSPEALADRPVDPRSDVYCLGVILLELLTGKFPSQYLDSAEGGTDVVHWATYSIGEGREAEILDPALVAGAQSSIPDMKRLLRVAVDCADPDPDRRIELREAVERIEEVAAEVETAAPGERSGRRVGSIGEASERRSDSSFSSVMS